MRAADLGGALHGAGAQYCDVLPPRALAQPLWAFDQLHRVLARPQPQPRASDKG